MCTLTWVHTALAKASDSKDISSSSGYQIHFNRDESRLRTRALPPQLLENNGAKYLAPIDQDAGGTWIFVNSWGFAVCLLNNYIDVKDNGLLPRNPRSRGLLVKDISHLRSVREALLALDKAGIENYAPFDMYLFDFEGAYSIGWNGENRTDHENPDSFKSSSAFNAEEVIDSRKKLFLESRSANQSLREFHRSHVPDKSAYSVCMHRHDACTQSYTEILVGPHDASISYTDGPPCKAPLSAPLSLSLNS